MISRALATVDVCYQPMQAQVHTFAGLDYQSIPHIVIFFQDQSHIRQKLGQLDSQALPSTVHG